MTNYNLILPIKDNLQSKQVLKQSLESLQGKETKTTACFHLRQRCSAGCWACWQHQENPCRHVELTSTELHKMLKPCWKASRKIWQLQMVPVVLHHNAVQTGRSERPQHSCQKQLEAAGWPVRRHCPSSASHQDISSKPGSARRLPHIFE